MRLLIGTDDGLYDLDDGAPRRMGAGRVTHLAVDNGKAWAIIDDRVVRLANGSPEPLPAPGHVTPRCLLPLGHSLLIGTSGAHLYRSDGGEPVLVDGFEQAAGRESWHTPWGGPPDTRSLARDVGGAIYANVHVGGVLRSTDGERWEPTMEIAADVHEVIAHPRRAGSVAVASARGLGVSFDGADTWQFTREGLHNAYARAVAVAGDTVLISASDGPRGGRAAVYRRSIDSSAALDRCRAGLPEWFAGNIDSGCLAASGGEAAFGTADGTVYVSADAGSTWIQAAAGLPPVRALAPM